MGLPSGGDHPPSVGHGGGQPGQSDLLVRLLPARGVTIDGHGREALREMLHQVAEQAAGDLEGQMKLLNAVGKACTQLANLVKVQKQIGGKTTWMDEISRIAAEIHEEEGEEDW